jgi:hypothetical protein
MPPLDSRNPQSSAFATEIAVFARGGGDLREPQTCLDRCQYEGMIAPPEPGALIASTEQGIDLWTSEKADQAQPPM